jgi:ribosomal protein S18 acetylase RimI-like enzyme
MSDISQLPTEQLDNPFWYALAGPHRALGTVGERAGRYLPGVAVMAGLAEVDPDAWHELATLTPPGEVVALFRPTLLDAPDGWTHLSTFGPLQMVAPELMTPLPDPKGLVMRPLAVQDVPAMLELVKLTRPGPFAPRTRELGLYLGLWDESAAGEPRLAAMTGQRARTQNACEVSAVCTHPDYRRRGLALVLVSQMAAQIQAAGLLPFLHVDPQNQAAQATYLGLGFVPRQPMSVTVLRRAEQAP